MLMSSRVPQDREAIVIHIDRGECLAHFSTDTAPKTSNKMVIFLYFYLHFYIDKLTIINI